MGNPVNGVRASQREESSSVSKFDRYRKQDEEVDETMDDGIFFFLILFERQFLFLH